jgi:hypothetical protein
MGYKEPVVIDQEEPSLPAFEHHVFVCCNTRPEGAPRPSCTRDGTSGLHAELQQRVKAAGLGGRVRINKSGVQRRPDAVS